MIKMRVGAELMTEWMRAERKTEGQSQSEKQEELPKQQKYWHKKEGREKAQGNEEEVSLEARERDDAIRSTTPSTDKGKELSKWASEEE